jgi:hypothetical protein
MPPPTIIRFLDRQDTPNAVWFFLAKPNMNSAFCQLNADPDHPPYSDLQAGNIPPGAVGTAGLALFQELMAHNAVAAHFAQVFADTSKDPPRPIGMQVDSPRADSLPWEILCRQANEFLALDRRWPVVRLLETTDDKLKQDYEYVPPVRIAAILSACWGSTPERRISAKDEWKSLEKGIVANPGAAPSSLLVLVCEKALKDQIDQKNHPNVRTHLITDQNQMSALIKNFHPHILHLFCHGHSGEKSYLRIANAYDQISNQDGSIYLLPGDLRQDIDAEETSWLIVLNCCDGANAIRSGDTRNLAASLVKAGFPAVIGMREPVESDYARLLTEALYSELLPKLEALSYGQISPLEWAEMLVSGRKDLRNKSAPQSAGPNAAASTKEWAIPAVYMRMLPFRMRKIAPKLPESERLTIIAKLAELREQRNSALQMSLPATIKQQMLAEFDQLIQAEENRLL